MSYFENLTFSEKIHYYIKSNGEIIDVILMEIKYDEYNKGLYLMVICEKKKLDKLKELEIKSKFDQSIKIVINLKNERDISEIKTNNEVVTFVQIFTNEANREISNSENYAKYKAHIDKLVNKIKFSQFIRKQKIKIIACISAFFIIIIGIIVYLKLKLPDKQSREKEDDPNLSDNNIYIKDYNYRYENAKNIKIFYNNSYKKI